MELHTSVLQGQLERGSGIVYFCIIIKVGVDYMMGEYGIRVQVLTKSKNKQTNKKTGGRLKRYGAVY